MSLPILLTASIDPRGMSNALFLPEERESQYVNTLNAYIERFSRFSGEWRFVFVENSGWPKDHILTQLKQSSNVKIEYIALDPSGFDVSKGKGYNEMLMIEQALEISQFIKEAKHFFKLTGRYIFTNLYQLINEIEKRTKGNFQFYADVKDHNVYDCLHIPIFAHFGECRFYAASVDFWNRNMKNQYQYLNDTGWSVELLFLDIVRKSKGQDGVFIRFRTQPFIQGSGGYVAKKGLLGYNNVYNSFGNRVKDYIRQILRWILPFWWV